MEPSTYTTLRRSRVRTLRLATMLAGVLTAPLALVATTAAPAIADPESATTTTTTTFAFTGGVQSWTAPAGMTRAEVTLFGAAGEAGGGAHGPYYPGGKGAAVTAVIAVTPGHSYDVYVGGTGDDGRGGFNGGGSARHYGGTNSVAGSGGGASDLRLGGGTLDDRLLVAGGGGGGGGGTGPNYGSTGGSVGGSGGDSGTGSPATPGGDDPHSSALGGHPGAAGAEGGAGGTGGTGRFSGERGGTGENGSFGLGGSPTFYPSTGGLGVGGAGGGGYVGGGAGGGGATSWDIGGGAGGGGGGGGSNYVTPLALTSSVIDGVRAGQGEVTISAFSTATAPTGVTATAGNGEATVSFSPPVSDGNSAITGYTVTAVDATNAGRGGQTATGTGGPITLTGLTNGDSYTFTVTATNAAGPGDPGTSNAVTPSAPVTVNKADITVGVSGPTSAKKGAAVSYQVTISNNGPAVARSLTTVFAGTGFIGLHANPTTGSGTMTVAGTRITGLRWTMAELASGATVTYTVSGTLTTSIGRSSSVIAAALSNVPDPSMLNNLATARTGSTK